MPMPDLTDLPAHELVGPDAERLRRHLVAGIPATFDRYRAGHVDGWEPAPCPTVCSCSPCTTPAYGAPGFAHCAACCSGTGIAEYDHLCVVPEHRSLAHRQFGPLVLEVPA